jgi:cell wall-associated NlpC family hydrolase
MAKHSASRKRNQKLQIAGGIAASASLLAPSGVIPLAEPVVKPDDLRVLTEAVPLIPVVRVSTSVKVSYPRPAVGSSPAPPPPVEQAPPPEAAPADSPVVTGRHAIVPEPRHAAPPAVQAPVAVASGSVILAAALSQLGQAQDCTALVSRSLAAAGILYHGWPAGYLSLGPQVSPAAAQPGDLIFYSDGGMGVPHIAVYAGNGLAVHGGWFGGQTVEATAYVGSGPIFIHI